MTACIAGLESLHSGKTFTASVIAHRQVLEASHFLIPKLPRLETVMPGKYQKYWSTVMDTILRWNLQDDAASHTVNDTNIFAFSAARSLLFAAQILTDFFSFFQQSLTIFVSQSSLGGPCADPVRQSPAIFDNNWSKHYLRADRSLCLLRCQASGLVYPTWISSRGTRKQRSSSIPQAQ